MKMTPTLRYVLFGFLFLIVAGLAGWYFFIRSQQEEISRQDTARGAGLPSQSLESRLGSTYENLVSNISSISSTFTEQRESSAQTPPTLAQISKTPVAGLDFVGNATSTRIRFVERSTGFVFDTDPATLELIRLTNTLMPAMYEAYIAPKDRLLLRGIDESGVSATIAVELSSTSTPEGLRGLITTRLPNDLKTAVVSPSSEEVFYIAEGARGGVGVMSSWDASDQTPIFSSALSGWRARWSNNDKITVVQRAADGVGGHAFVVGPGERTEAVSDIPGLTLLPHPTSAMILYGSSSGSSISLFARQDAVSAPVTLPVQTIAEKCVWSPREFGVAFCAVPQARPPANFLNQWYRGEVHTSDAWWRVDTRSASAELIFSPTNSSLDTENPTIDASGSYIAFMNAVDKSPWLLRIPDEGSSE